MKYAWLVLPLVLIGCAPIRPVPIETGLKQNDHFSMEGTRRMAHILEDILKTGQPVTLAISIKSKTDSNLPPDQKMNEEKDISVGTDAIAKREFRDYLRIYPKFSIVDYEALENLSDASHLLTMNVSYSNQGTWNGKLIDLKTKKTLGEYYCIVPPNEKTATCN